MYKIKWNNFENINSPQTIKGLPTSSPNSIINTGGGSLVKGGGGKGPILEGDGRAIKPNY